MTATAPVKKKARASLHTRSGTRKTLRRVTRADRFGVESFIAPGGAALDEDAILATLDRISAGETSILDLNAFVAEVVSYAGTPLAKAGLYITIANWAIAAPPVWRSRVWRAFSDAGASEVLPKLAAVLPDDRARSLLAVEPDILRSCVLPWLASVYAQRARPTRQTRDFTAVTPPHADGVAFRRLSLPDFADRFSDWLVDPAKAILDELRGGATKVLALLRDGALALADVVAAVATLAVDALADVVRDLVEAGVRIVDLLTEAARTGLDALDRFVEATWRSIHRVNEFIEWLGANVPFAGKVVATLLRVGVLPLEIVVCAVWTATSVLTDVVRAVIDGVDGIVHFVAGIAVASIETLRAIAKQLIQLGHDLTSIVAAMATAVGDDLVRGNLLRAFIDVGVGIGDLALAGVRAGAGVSAATVAGLICACGGRKLSEEQKHWARLVFGRWEQLDNVRIATGGTLPNLLCKALAQDRPYTTLYLVNFPPGAEPTPSVLVHELVHVWQNCERGPGYMVESLEARLRQGDAAAYRYEQRDLEAGKPWTSFNVEQQASIIEDYFRRRYDPTSYRQLDEVSAYLPYARMVFSPPEALDTNLSDEKPRPSSSGHSSPHLEVEYDAHGNLLLHDLILQMHLTHVDTHKLNEPITVR